MLLSYSIDDKSAATSFILFDADSRNASENGIITDGASFREAKDNGNTSTYDITSSCLSDNLLLVLSASLNLSESAPPFENRNKNKKRAKKSKKEQKI
jgi:hypothetical protein